MANEAPETTDTAETTPAQAPPETVETDTAMVRCDGGGNALGHPVVYLNMGQKTWVECPYCDRRFVLKAGAPAH